MKPESRLPQGKPGDSDDTDSAAVDTRREARDSSITLKVPSSEVEIARFVARARGSFHRDHPDKPVISPLLLTMSWSEIVAEGRRLLDAADAVKKKNA